MKKRRQKKPTFIERKILMKYLNLRRVECKVKEMSALLNENYYEAVIANAERKIVHTIQRELATFSNEHLQSITAHYIERANEEIDVYTKKRHRKIEEERKAYCKQKRRRDDEETGTEKKSSHAGKVS